MTMSNAEPEELIELRSKFRALVIDNQRRLAANLKLSSALRIAIDVERDAGLPEAILPHLADLTFSDGAAFVYAMPDGKLSIEQSSPAAVGATVPVTAHSTPFGRLWHVCVGGVIGHAPGRAELMANHLSSRKIEQLGVDLPPSSSIMAKRLESDFYPDTCVAVWRASAGRRQYSSDFYQVWDSEPFCVAAGYLRGVVDSREYCRETTRLQSLRSAARTILDVSKPLLSELHEVARSLPTELGTTLNAKLEALDSAMSQAEQSILLASVQREDD